MLTTARAIARHLPRPGLFRTVGTEATRGSITDLEQRSGSHYRQQSAESHPVNCGRIKSSHKLFGQKLIVSDLRENEMATRADLFNPSQAGTDLVWLNAISRYYWTTARPTRNSWISGSTGWTSTGRAWSPSPWKPLLELPACLLKL